MASPFRLAEVRGTVRDLIRAEDALSVAEIVAEFSGRLDRRTGFQGNLPIPP